MVVGKLERHLRRKTYHGDLTEQEIRQIAAGAKGRRQATATHQEPIATHQVPIATH